MSEPIWYRSQQSPIDIHKDQSFLLAEGQLELHSSGYDKPCKGTFVYEDHHWNFVLKGAAPTIRFGNRTATLAKIHTHTRSEHDLEGLDRGGEIHLIHKIKSPANGDSVYIVIGIVFDHRETASHFHEGLSAKDDALLNQLKVFHDKTMATRHSGKASSPQVILDLEPFLAYMPKWYTYEGALTSPEYDEIVTWIVCSTVMKLNPPPFSLQMLDLFACQPERKTKPLNRRYLLRNFA